ncbi:LppX_LprAFG lipoprotein [Nocardioides campestrisoli]|uniref:LppX_LprAFG lipoprotein n=1 Tax=Nocardioides campestrisoli TaxID=2736757 RepID=UPI0015E64455|nr:LppX_LprAFG lipoprotein [Nocardioides campestrisoli]
MPTPAPTSTTRRAQLAKGLGAALLGLGVLTGCSSEDDLSDQDVEEVLAQASDTLLETSGLQLRLATDDLPDGVTGITSAEGVATDAPAFEGDLRVRLAGNDFTVPVVAVDGTVWAQIPLTPGWSDVDPAEYGAPDPALLISPDQGFATLLQEVQDPEAVEQERGGVDNAEVLTRYAGTVDGAVMENVIPSSAGDSFDVEFLVTEDGELRRAELSGVFYADSDEMTYTVDLTDYGTTQQITAP